MAADKFTPALIAPCGMNCGLCKSYLAYSRGVPTEKGKVSHCAGCRIRDKNCAFIKRNCPKKVGKHLMSCSECDEIPCRRLKHLDQHYQEHYCMSMVKNLKEIREKSIEEFLKDQEAKFRCPSCGDVVSIHDGKCYACGYKSSYIGRRSGTFWKPIKKVSNGNGKL